VYPIVMCKTVLRLLCVLSLLCFGLAKAIPAQRASAAPSVEESAYGAGFFEQLSTIFGRFRDADLERVFREAQPIQCTELVGRKGEWRSVAFFNEDRRLGDWYRKNLEEVKGDLAVYKFRGACSGDQATIRVETEFPTAASLDAYAKRQIDLDHVDITVNDPVKIVLNPRTMAFTFELPYLFLTDQSSKKVYSFMAPDSTAAYAEGVSSRWECKLAASKDVTYRFLICRVGTVPQGSAANKTRWQSAFGSSAFFVLSDGIEARSSVNMSFGNKSPSNEKPQDTEPASTEPARPTLKRR
jgi:hypothetical protein